jgi:hypothetical protein
MLIALADRMDFVLSTPSIRASRREKWFWLFIDNLNLDKYDYDFPDVFEKKNANNAKIMKLLERHYDDNGKGGIFPLRHPMADQRRIEIWYQMMAYISENYKI